MFFLIPFTLVLLAIAVYFFFWAVDNDQFNDVDSPSKHILLDDKKKDD